MKKRQFPTKNVDDKALLAPSTEVFEDRKTIEAHPAKAKATPDTHDQLKGSQPKLIEIAAVRMGCEGCHTAAATGPANLMPTIPPA